MKVLHVLYQSLPYLSGTSIRSRDIIQSQKDIGIEVIAITSPFQKPLSPNNANTFEKIYDVLHYRTFNKRNLEVTEGVSSFRTKIKKLTYIFSFTNRLLKIIEKEKPDVLHAHATFFTAFATKYCSIRKKVPFVYEVRSLWDERQKQLAKTKWQKIQIKLITWLENKAINSADKVVTINENLRNTLHTRGIKKEIIVIKNGVNLSLLPKSIDESKFEEKLNNNATLNFAYLGSITFIEGLPFLAKAFKKLEDLPVRLDIYGVGPVLIELEKTLRDYNIKNVFIKGPFQPEKVATIYSQVDCIINPRIKNKLSDSVTPLKPLEALAYKKLFLGSDVGGIKELIIDNESGFLFKAEDEESLIERIKYIINRENLTKINQIICDGNKLVKERFSWESNALIYKKLYSELLNLDEKQL